MRSLPLLGLLFIASAAPVRAAVPGTLRFQGRILETSSLDPRSESSLGITFRIYDAASAGSLLWTEGPNTVSLDEGAFDALLGASVPLSSAVFSAAGRWLEVEVAGQTLSPRQRLNAVPWALRAAVADYLEPGSTNYLQNAQDPQAGSEFFVSSAAVSGQFTGYGEVRSQADTKVSGILRAGTGTVALTGAAGLLDAARADTATKVPNESLDNSSVTKLGNAVAGPSGLALLNVSGFVPTGALDSLTVTEEGSSFNGGGQLTLLSPAALVENYNIDGSSVAKLSLSGQVYNTELDLSSVTKQGNTFNGSEQLVKLDGAGYVPNSLVDASSVAKYAANGKYQHYALDPGSATKAGNSFNAAGKLVQLDASATLNLPGSGSGVYSMATSSGINVTGAGAKVREGGFDLVPQNILIIWLGPACPGGWSEETSMRGRTPLGNCSGCTAGTTNATALTTDGQLVTHRHDLSGGGAMLRTGGNDLFTDDADTTVPYIQVLFCRKD
ncbi:MAG: hypothetical protein HY928_00225 [Elusimicrobia bacterium]|nr:hypothetical protein [Elusimicrobiota bacterium]